jgi:ribonuclease P protein component
VLKKENRLSTDFEFNVTRKHGTKINGDLCSIFFIKPKNYQGPVKVGIVVPKKISKIAVKRNKLKRVFSECVRKEIDNLPQDTWVVIHPKPSSLGEKYEKISTDVNKVLSKVPIS